MKKIKNKKLKMKHRNKNHYRYAPELIEAIIRIDLLANLREMLNATAKEVKYE